MTCPKCGAPEEKLEYTEVVRVKRTYAVKDGKPDLEGKPIFTTDIEVEHINLYCNFCHADTTADIDADSHKIELPAPFHLSVHL